MERIKLGTPDLTQENIQRLGELFPQVMTEVWDENGQVQRAVDFDALRDLLGDVAEDARERYQFTWPGKREAKAEARRPIQKTMRPCPEESVNWDTTENLYIEGDNLDALKILKETYAGKVKMIYIDPPYNTGHDFVYDDDFARTHGEYDAGTADYNDEGGRLVANPESNGRFHSDWCSMMYPRLLIARDLLSVNGVIFISIDDNELENLKKICEEVFGEKNFVANIVWKHTQQSKNDEKHFSRQYNHTLLYAKNKSSLHRFYFERSEEDNANYRNPDNDPKGMWRSGDVRSPNYRKTLCYDIVAPNGSIIKAPDNGWRWSEESLREKIASGEIKFKEDGTGIIRKIYLCDQPGRTPENLWEGNRFGTTRQAAAMIKDLFDGVQVFDTPKPIELIRSMMIVALDDPNATILDFFSGSSTVAHAAMQLNAEDNGKRKYIMVQIPEETDDKSEAAKAGYANICEIGKERIRRAGTKIADEVEEANKRLKLGEGPKKVPDIGFRVLKIESSNFDDTFATPAETDQGSLFSLVDNVKAGRTGLDILFEVLPKFQIPYSAKIKELSICGKRCFSVDDGYLLACFDRDVDTDTIEAIAKMQPYYAVMRDASMADDATHANFEELFKTYSPDTIRRVI